MSARTAYALAHPATDHLHLTTDRSPATKRRQQAARQLVGAADGR